MCATRFQKASLVGEAATSPKNFLLSRKDCATLRQKTDTNDSSGQPAFLVQFQLSGLLFSNIARDVQFVGCGLDVFESVGLLTYSQFFSVPVVPNSFLEEIRMLAPSLRLLSRMLPVALTMILAASGAMAQQTYSSPTAPQSSSQNSASQSDQRAGQQAPATGPQAPASTGGSIA